MNRIFISTFFLVISTLVFGANEKINNLFDLISKGKTRDIQIYLKKNKPIYVEDDFGDLVDKTSDVRSLITRLDSFKKECLTELKFLENDLREYRLDKYNSKCGEKTTIKEINEKVKTEFGYSNVLNQFTKKISPRVSKIKERLGQLQRKKQAEDNKNKKYLSSAAFSLDETCKGVKLVQHYNKVITDEKRASKYSGQINKRKMYELGKSLDHWVKYVSRYSAQYSERSGNKFKNSMCNVD